MKLPVLNRFAFLVCLLAIASPPVLADERPEVRFERSTLVVSDLQPSIAFWQDVMGYDLIMDARTLPVSENAALGWTEAATVRFAQLMSSSGTGIGLLEISETGFPDLEINRSPTGIGGVVLVHTSTEIDALHERAAKAGAVIKPLGLSPTGLSWNLYLQAPSGHILEVYQLRPANDRDGSSGG